MSNRLKFLMGFVGFLALLSILFAIVWAQVNNVRSRRLVIATTTSTVDSGLLNYLRPYFESEFNANMTWLYLGTGQAIAVASRGDADILLGHDRVREDAFIKSGNGTHRVTIMYNDFILIGPADDPAGIKGSHNATDAFRRIAQAGNQGKAIFVSRGDGSGTEALELGIWASIGFSTAVLSANKWYLQAGQGMAPTIKITNEKLGYTISDRASFAKLVSQMNSSLRLSVLVEGDSILLNPYGLILLNPSKYPDINNRLAEKFFLFMVSAEGQGLIANYTLGGQQLFHPVFGNPESIGLPSEKIEVDYWIDKLRANGMEPPK